MRLYLLFSLLLLLICFFYSLSHGGEIDIFYGFIVYLQVASFLYFGERKKWLQLFILSYMFCAAGFLTKGFSSPLFQVLTLISFAVYQRSFDLFFSWQHLVGIVVFAACVGGDLYWYSFYSSPQQLIVNLLNEAFKKTAIGENSEKLWPKVVVYPISFFKLLMPWGLLILLLFKKHSFRIFDNPLTRFSILFIVFNIWVYWFTGRPIMRYVYMFLPFAFSIIACIYWKFSLQFPGRIEKWLRQLMWLFVLVLIAVILFPCFKPVSLTGTIIIAVALISFTYFFFQKNTIKLWQVGMGFIILRLAYAWLVIPVQNELINPHYKKEIAAMVQVAQNNQVVYWTPPELFEVAVDLKLAKWKLESVISPPVIFCQIPYYYHKYTGKLMLYDTARRNDQLYFTRGDLIKANEEITWKWFDKRQGIELVLFKQK